MSDAEEEDFKTGRDVGGEEVDAALSGSSSDESSSRTGEGAPESGGDDMVKTSSKTGTRRDPFWPLLNLTAVNQGDKKATKEIKADSSPKRHQQTVGQLLISPRRAQPKQPPKTEEEAEAPVSPRRRQATGQLLVSPRRAAVSLRANAKILETPSPLTEKSILGGVKKRGAKESPASKEVIHDVEDGSVSEEFEIVETWELGNPWDVLFAWRSIAAEFLALILMTFVATATGCATVGRTGQFDGGALATIGLVAGFMVATMVHATANLSGGHLNPALTIAIAVCKKMPLLQALGYIIFQLIGSIGGAALTRVLFPAIIGERVHWGVPSLATNVTSSMVLLNGTIVEYQYGVSPLQGVFIEALLTFILVFTIFSTAGIAQDAKSMGRFAPLSSGFAVLVCVIIGAPFSGGALSPARAFGPAVIANQWTDHWVWWAGPILGAVVAGLTYKIVFITSDEMREQVRIAERLFAEQERQARLGRLVRCNLCGQFT